MSVKLCSAVHNKCGENWLNVIEGESLWMSKCQSDGGLLEWATFYDIYTELSISILKQNHFYETEYKDVVLCFFHSGGQ